MVDLANPNNSINVLLVEDDAGSRKLVRHALCSGNQSIRYDISEAEDLASATRMLGERDYDNVILDLHLPDSRGLDTLQSIKKTVPDVPVVVLSGISDYETAVEAIKHGADYYMVKGEMLREMLGRTICFSIERKRRQLETENQEKLQGHVDQLHYQIREIKDSLSDQMSINNEVDSSIKQVNDEHEKFLDLLPAMIWHIDNDGRIVKINSSAAGLIGEKSADLKGEDFYTHFPANDEYAKLKHELIFRDGTASEEITEAYKSHTGTIEYHPTEVVPYRDKSGAITGLVIMAKSTASKEKEIAVSSSSSVLAKSLKQKFSPDNNFMKRKAGAVRVEESGGKNKQYSGKILVVDQDSLNRVLIGSHLKGSGLEIDFAVGGLEALEKSQSVAYDLVLSAYMMPELDGLEVVHKLRMDGFGGPVVVMTTDYSDDVQGKINDCGGTGHIFKPINKKDLFAIFDKHMIAAVESK